MEYHYKTKGTCSRRIDVELEDGRIKTVKFHGGCNGNLQGITALIQGAPALEIGSVKASSAECAEPRARISLPMRWRRLWPLRNYRKRLEQIKILFKRITG